MPDDLFTIPLDAPVGSEAWLAARFSYFNCSDAAALFDAHPYRTLGDIAVEKMQPAPPEPVDNPRMARGRRLEPYVARMWWEQNATDDNVALVTPDRWYGHGRLLASLDYLIDDDAILEIKTTTKRLGKTCPDEWVYQVQGQMACTGLDMAYIAALDGNLELVTYEIPRRHELIDELMRRVEQFWAAIDLGMLPTGAHPSFERLTDLYPVAHVATAELPAEALPALDALFDARERIRVAQFSEKEAKAKLATMLGDAEVGVLDGQPMVSWKNQKPRQTLDTAALERDHPDLIPRYMVEKPGPRVMRIIGGVDQ